MGCSFFSAQGDDFFSQYEEGTDGTGQKHGVKAVENHGRQGFRFRQKAAEQQNKHCFYGSDAGRCGDYSGKRLA